MIEQPQALTARELASRWHVHPNTVKRIADRGELRQFRIGRRGDRRFRLDDVMAYEQRGPWAHG